MHAKAHIPWTLLLGAVLLAGLGSAAGAEVTVSARVSKTVVQLHDSVQLHVTLSGARQGARVMLPKLAGFQVVAGPSTQSSMQMVNGRVTQSLSYVYTLRAIGVGVHTIPAIQVRYGRNWLATEPVTVKVIKATDGSRQLTLDQAAFVELAAGKSDAYVYEQVVLSLKLYVVEGFDVTDLSGNVTAGKDFLEESFGRAKAQKETQTTRDGLTYKVRDIPLSAVFPVVSGKLTIPSTEITGVLLAPNRQRDSRGFRDPFDGFFGRGRYKRYNWRGTTPPFSLEVKPLPDEGKPADGADVVGAYDLHVTVGPQNVRVRDGLTLTMVVSGQGYIKAVTEPRLESEDGFKVYRSEVTQDTTWLHGAMGGRKVFKKIIEPQSEAITEVPVVTFTFFDPRLGRYTALRRGPFPVTVTPTEVERPIAYQPIVIGDDAKQGVTIQAKDIQPIMASYSSFPNQAARLHRHPAVAVAAGLPPLVLLLSLLLQRKRERLITDAGYARGRRALGRAKKRLREAKARLARGDRAGAHAALSQALSAFIADKLDRPAASVSPLSVTELLQAAGVADDLAARVREALEACDDARFAPTSKPADELGLDHRSMARLIRELDRKL